MKGVFGGEGEYIGRGKVQKEKKRKRKNEAGLIRCGFDFFELITFGWPFTVDQGHV